MAIAPAASDSADSSPPTLSPDQLPLLNRPRMAAAGPAPDLRSQVYQKWIDAGATPQGADAILRRLNVESGLNPNAVGDSGTSVGLYQHHADRAQRLEAYAASQGKSPADPIVQTDFAIKEVTQGLDPIAAAHAREILSGSDPNAFTRYFERPAVSGISSDLAQIGSRIRDQHYAQAGALNKNAQQLISKIGDMEADLPKSLAKIDEARKAADTASERAIGQLQKQPTPPEIDGVQKMGGIATIVGMLGGLLTRQPLIASLNAAGAAISAYNDGDRERYKLAYDNWKSQNDLLFKIADMQAKRVSDIMQDEKFGLEERRTMLDLTLRAMNMGNLADQAKIEGDEAIARYVTQAEQLQIQHQQLQRSLDHDNHVREEEDAKNPAAAAYREAVKSDPTLQGTSPEAIERREQLFNELNKKFQSTKGREFDAPKNIEVIDSKGETIWQGAAERDRQGNWVKSGSKESIPEGEVKLLPGTAMVVGSRENVLIQRSLTAGQEITSELSNLAKMPVTVNRGIFGGRGQGPSLFEATKEDLANTVTTQEVQIYNAAVAGVQRELAGLVTGGVYINQHIIDAFNQLTLKEGDTYDTKMYKMATIRQNAENALEAVLTNPRIGQKQRELAQHQVDAMKTAVPWTPADVIALINAENPQTTLKEYSEQRGLGDQGPPVSLLKEGVETDFNNGQTWTLKGGKAVKVR